MFRRKHIAAIFVTLITLFAMSLFAVTASAQDTISDSVTIIGDADSPNLEVVREYLNTYNADLLAEDALLYDQPTAEPIRGREEIERVQNILYGRTFTDIETSPRQFVVAEDTVVVEYVYQASNMGPGALAPRDAMQITLPMVSIFEVTDGKIVSIRQFYDANTIQAQLGYVGATAVPGTTLTRTATPLNTTDAEDITQNPADYFGIDLFVEGVITERISDKVFLLTDRNLIEFNDDPLLVVNTAEDGIVPLVDTNISVNGVVQEFTMENVNAMVAFDIDESLFDTYEGAAVLFAENVRPLDPIQTVTNIEANPNAFMGETVEVEGYVDDILGPNSFVSEDADLIEFDFDSEEVVVIDNTEDDVDLTELINNNATITGVVRRLSLEDLSAEYGIDFTSDDLEDYVGQPVIVAEEVIIEQG